MDLVRLSALERTGGSVWEKYKRLAAAADASASGSVAEQQLQQFFREWENDQAAAIAAAEAEAAAVAQPDLAAEGAGV